MASELIVDQSNWGQIRVSGADRMRFLQAMCTADVESIAPGGWARAAILTTKARVVSVIDIVYRADREDFLLLCEPGLEEKTSKVLEKHAIMDDVEFGSESLAVYRVWGAPETVWEAPPVFGPLPGPPASEAEIEIRRVEAGLPKYGVDVDEQYLPFESTLVRAINYDKGCYLGQEPVKRARTRGQANKTLRGLRVDGQGAINPGAAVAHPDRERAGTVTSAVVSPDFGSIALAYVHRSVWSPGTAVTVEDRSAEVVELPFR